MIKSWKHKGLRDFYISSTTKGIIVEHADRITIILQMLNNARYAKQMDVPGFKFHKLQGKLKDFYSVHGTCKSENYIPI